nr:HlyD family efflux transporter periplasmic adaptor subunit [uncultured Cupriavidus sp.]
MDEPSKTTTPTQPKKKWLIPASVTFLATAAALAAWTILPFDTERTEDAYVDGNAIQITSQIVGTVVSISADNTDNVEAGVPLVKLNPVDKEVDFERAKAALAKATRQARTQYSQVDQLQAEVRQRENDLRKARADLARRAELASDGAVSREEINHAEEAARNAEAALQATIQQLAQRRALVDNTSLHTHPDVQAAASNLRDAYVALARTTIRSPAGGIVTKRSVQVGQRINPGVALMSVVPLDGVWVSANFKESQLEHLRIGQPVKLHADAYGSDVIYHGKVVGLDAGTGSAFALLPAQNATGNWIKVTQRVPVRIALDPQEVKSKPLRIGLSMRVGVDTSDQRGAIIKPSSERGAAYETKVFERELEDAGALVESIIRQNAGAATDNPRERASN